MQGRIGLIAGIGVGSGLMYFLDPFRGRRRRAILRDRTQSISRRLANSVDKTANDIANRTHGLAREIESLWKPEEVSDPVLQARVHTRIGRLVSHPREIDVTANEGVIVLRGAVLESEASSLLAGVAAVGGVKKIDNRLRMYRNASGVPGLQGGSRRIHSHNLLAHDSWPPATRFLMGAAGGAMVVAGVSVAGKKGAIGAALTVSGAGLLVRGITNRNIAQLAGMPDGSWEIDLRRSLNLAVPVDKAFEFWANYQNFPRFMSHIKEVRDLGQGRSHWVAEGPAGMAIEWNAEMTAVEPNSLIAWQSIPVSMIENAGTVQFTPNPDGSTRLDIHLCYNTPAGATGRLVGKLLGADPRRAMNDDLLRLKALLEVGKTTVHGEKITRDELAGVAKTLVPATAPLN